MIRITSSEHRKTSPQILEFGENLTLTTWGTIKISKTHFFPSSFQLKSGNRVLYIDPIEVEHPEKADYIFITHSHPDHLSLKDITKLASEKTIIVCPKSAISKLKKIDAQVNMIKPTDKIDFIDLSVEATSAYNNTAIFLWIKAHPKSKKNVGYILTLKNGFRVYHCGDTDYLQEMNAIRDIDLALIPIGGDNLTMNVEDAALIVNQIKPSMVIPMHYEILKKKQVERFKNLIDVGIKVIEF